MKSTSAHSRAAARRTPALSANPIIDDALDQALLLALVPIAPPRAAKARMLKTLMQRTAQIRRPAPTGAAERTGTPRRPVTIAGGSAPWKRFAPGIERKVLFREAGTFAFLLRLEAGAAIPQHEHAHHEECLVLEGAVEIDGTMVRAGDFHFAPQGVRHLPIRAHVPSVLYLRTVA